MCSFEMCYVMMVVILTSLKHWHILYPLDPPWKFQEFKHVGISWILVPPQCSFQLVNDVQWIQWIQCPSRCQQHPAACLLSGLHHLPKIEPSIWYFRSELRSSPPQKIPGTRWNPHPFAPKYIWLQWHGHRRSKLHAFWASSAHPGSRPGIAVMTSWDWAVEWLQAWGNWDSQSYPFWSILIPQKIQTTCPTCCLVTCGCSILGQASAIVQVPMPHKAIQQPAVSWLVTTNNEHLDLSANGVYLQYSHFHGGFGVTLPL